MEQIKEKTGQCFRLILLFLIVVGLSGCGGTKHDLEAVTDNFCEAYNHLDYDGMMECIEPDVSDIVNSVIDFGTELLGMDDELTESFMETVTKILGNDEIRSEILEDSEGIDSFPKLEIELVSIQIDKENDTAEAEAQVTFTSDGNEETTEGTLYFVCEDGVWYLSIKNFMP